MQFRSGEELVQIGDASTKQSIVRTGGVTLREGEARLSAKQRWRKSCILSACSWHEHRCQGAHDRKVDLVQTGAEVSSPKEARGWVHASRGAGWCDR